MQILQKRQTGESELPASLTYGEIAIDKRGRLHTADAAGKVVNPLGPALEAVSSTQYDVKMLQLQEILEKKEPPMLGGFAEGFGDTKKQYTKSKCTVDTSAHQLKFDGDNEVNANEFFGATNIGAAYTTNTVTAVISAAKAEGTIKSVSFWVEVQHAAPEASFYTGKIYGLQNPNESGTLLGGNLEGNGFEFRVTLDNPAKYPYYKAVITRIRTEVVIVGGRDGAGDFESLSTDGSGVYPSANASISYYKDATAPVDGYYTTKVIDLGVPVESGEVYLHYPALPAGATLAVKLGTDTKNHVALSPEGEERTVTLGGKSLRERKYRVPTYAKAVSGVSVRVDGHREKLSDVLSVNDICVAMR